jgi:hypothetical protein
VRHRAGKPPDDNYRALPLRGHTFKRIEHGYGI